MTISCFLRRYGFKMLFKVRKELTGALKLVAMTVCVLGIVYGRLKVIQ